MSEEPEHESRMVARRVTVYVFGPTTVRIDGAAVDLGRRQVRQLATAFAARSDWVSTDALIEHVWPTELPVNPRKALSVALSRLRSALGDQAHRVESSGNDYRLRFDSVDADEFTGLVESARLLDSSGASAAYEAALALWLAPPFSDELESDLVAGRRQSLEESRWFASVRLAELCNERGEPERAVQIAAGLAESGVVRERAVIVHATSLGMLGRKSEAIAVIAAAISELREGLGLEPSDALLEVERSLLADSVDLNVGSMKRPRPEAQSFIGRSDELETLRAVRPGSCVSIIAEAGMGKSALLSRFASDVAAGGRQVVRIDVAATPERPLDTIARLCLELCELSASVGEPSTPSEFESALARVCPELGLAGSGSLTREALVDLLTRFIELRASKAVIVIDDAHDVDSGSADVLAQLVRRGRLSMTFGLRPSDNGRLTFLQGSSPERAADDDSPGRCVVVNLQPFGRDDVIELIASCSTRQADPAFVDQLVERSGGNALFLRLLIDRWVEGRNSQVELPTSILVSVSERLDLLARSVVDTLQVGAAIGAPVDLHAIRQLRPNADVELAAAEAAGLVHVDDSAGAASFVHVVVAEACYQLLGEGRRTAVHEDIAATLVGDGASHAELAKHHVAAAALDPERAVWTSLHAAGEFIVGFDWETAARHLDSAVAIVARFEVEAETVRAQLHVRRGAVGRMLAASGYLDELYLGAELARNSGQDELFVVAVTELCGHGQTTQVVVDQRVAALLDEALALPVSRELRAELCAACVPLFATSDDADRGRQLYREAWKLAEELGDPEVEAAVVAHAHLGFGHPDDFELLAGAARRMTELAGHDVDLIWEAAFVRFECSVVVGDAAAAEQALDEMRLYTPRIMRRPREFGMAFSESAYARLIGDLAEAERHAEAALAVGLERYDASWAMTAYGLLLLGVRREQGRAGELSGVIGELVAGQPDYLPFRAVASLVDLEAGETDLVRSHLDLFSPELFGNIVPDVHYSSVLVLLAPAVAALGSADEVRALEALMRPFAGRMSWNSVSSDGPIDGGLALLAAARGDDEAAADYRAAAREIEARFRQRRSSEPGPKRASDTLPVQPTGQTDNAIAAS